MNLNIDLKNIDISDLSEKIKNQLNQLKEPKNAKKFGIYFVSIVLFLMLYYVMIKPTLDGQKVKIAKMIEYESKTSEYKSNISNLNAQVEKLRPQYLKNTKLFHSKKEVEDLYQSISNYALVNGLTILNLKKTEAVAIAKNNQANNNNDKKNVLYYKIPVDFQISGNFIGYLKFRQSLSKSNKHINFEKEQISIIQKNSSGAILADGTISIVGLPNEFN